MKQLIAFLFLLGSIGGIHLNEIKENFPQLPLASIKSGNLFRPNGKDLVFKKIFKNDKRLQSENDSVSNQEQYLNSDSTKVSKRTEKHKKNEQDPFDSNLFAKYSKINRLTGIRKYIRNKYH